jgi:DNA-binding LytR/AlgR family response regulator
MKILIVEDETAAYVNLRRIISEIDPNAEMIGNTESVKQTVGKLQNASVLPDLIFMDIQLSDGSAFNIFGAVQVNVPIVFTTAYDQYAIEAFKVNCIDYLLKPVEANAVKRALEKYRNLSHRNLMQYLNLLPQLTSPSENFPEKILISMNDKLIPVALDSIACFYTTEEKTTAMLKDGKTYPYKRTLDNIIQSLNPVKFFRVNKQFILAKDSIQNITVHFDNRLLILLEINTPERIFVSKNRAAEFKQWITS